MAEETGSASAFVVLTEEPDPMRAQLVAGALDVAGIPTLVDGDNLADEFAVSQKLMGLQRVRVLVPGDRLEEARTVFLAMSQPIPLVDDDDEEDDEHDAPVPLSTRGVLVVLVLALAVVVVPLVVSYGCAESDSDAPTEWGPGTPPPRPPEAPPPRPPILHK